MKSHIFIAIGILLLMVFFVQAYEALKLPGLGLSEIYVLGGFVFAGLLIRQGLKDREIDKTCLRLKSVYPLRLSSLQFAMRISHSIYNQKRK